MLFYISDRWQIFVSVGKLLVCMRCEIWFTILLDELTVIPTYFDEVYRKHPKGTFSRVKCKPSSASKAIDYSTVKFACHRWRESNYALFRQKSLPIFLGQGNKLRCVLYITISPAPSTAKDLFSCAIVLSWVS
jgi:hypothetical protein